MARSNLTLRGPQILRQICAQRICVSELYIFISELCALINENLKKIFYFQAGLFLVIFLLGFLAVWIQD